MTRPGESTAVHGGRAQRLVRRSRSHLSGARQRGKEFGWLLAGRLAMTGANSILMLVLYVELVDLHTFGVFATAVGAQLLLSRLVLLGVDQGVIRLFTVERSGEPPERVVGTGLGSALLLSLPLLLGGLLAAAIDLSGLHPLLTPAVAASIALGAAGSALFDYGYADHLARVEYRRAGLLQITMPIARLLATIAVALSTPLDSHAPLVAYALTALGFGAVQVARIGARHGLWPGVARIGGLLRYSLWIGLADVAMILALQQGLFLLGWLGQPSESGVFGFSLTLGMGFFSVYIAFYQMILPRAARIGSIADLPRFLRRVYTMAAVLIAVSIPLALAIGAWLPDLLALWKPDKPELTGFAPSFYWYAAFTMLLILEAPLGVTTHYLLAPHLQLAAMAVRVVAILGFGLALVPDQGALGAGRAQALGALVGFLALFVIVSRAVRTARRRHACAAS